MSARKKIESFRSAAIEASIEDLIALLDTIDGDPDLKTTRSKILTSGIRKHFPAKHIAHRVAIASHATPLKVCIFCTAFRGRLKDLSDAKLHRYQILMKPRCFPVQLFLSECNA